MLRFGELPAEAIQTLVNIKYTIKDMRARVNLKNYTNKIIKIVTNI